MCVRIDMKLSRQVVLDVLERRITTGESITQAAIADEIGCCLHTVFRAMRDLRATGRIQKIGRVNYPSRIEIIHDEH
jgi:predicted transcriptional regulator